MKKLTLILMIMMLSFSALPTNLANVQAEETEVEVEEDDNYYLDDSTELVGELVKQTRGVYLVSGSSIIRKYSSTQIAVGGDTLAAVECKVTVTVIVEKFITGEGWGRVTSWNTTKSKDVLVVASKILNISKGNKYRVRCTHYAASDVGSSCTDALKM